MRTNEIFRYQEIRAMEGSWPWIIRSFDMDRPETGKGEGVATSGLAELASKSRRWRDGEKWRRARGKGMCIEWRNAA